MEKEFKTGGDDSFCFVDGRLELSIYEQETGYDIYSGLTHEQTKELYEVMKEYFEEGV